MVRMGGVGVSAHMVCGPIHVVQHRVATTDSRSVDVNVEKDRIIEAQNRSIEQLTALAAKAKEVFTDDTSSLFETHALLVVDEDYVKCIVDVLIERHCSAECAVEAAGEKFSAMLLASDDSYMKERARDIMDVTRRIINNLGDVNEDLIDSDVPVVLAVDDLGPSELMQLDRSKLLGIITKFGSWNSHTSIIARSMGIPAVCGIGSELVKDHDGKMVCVDGCTGQIIIDPDQPTFVSFQSKMAMEQDLYELAKTMRGKGDVTQDGHHVKLYCNINSPDDVRNVITNGSQGIGLFRTEFLYMASNHCPTEEEQFNAYKEVASAMNGRRVIIRTLDIGADKNLSYLHIPYECNPALGTRGVRVYKKNPEVFYTQLRALYRASVYGNISIMFPMITSLQEVRWCKQICQKVMDDLDHDEIFYRDDVEIGIMIETPAAVLVASDLAREVKFFSIGTNDLTQYVLACDRQSSDARELFGSHHPAILQALKITTVAAHAAGIWVGICGDIATETSMVGTFLSIGIDELSVPPTDIFSIRAEIRNTNIAKINAKE